MHKILLLLLVCPQLLGSATTAVQSVDSIDDQETAKFVRSVEAYRDITGAHNAYSESRTNEEVNPSHTNKAELKKAKDVFVCAVRNHIADVTDLIHMEIILEQIVLSLDRSLVNEYVPTHAIRCGIDVDPFVLKICERPDLTEDHYKMLHLLLKRKFPVQSILEGANRRHVKHALLAHMILANQPPSEAALKMAGLLMNNPDADNRVNPNEEFVNDSGYQQTPLHYACAYGQVQWVKLLLDNGAEPKNP